MKKLTRAEEEIMHVLWKKGKAPLRDVVDALPPPAPHMNTVGTLLKILIEKEFVTAETFGRTNVYRPVISKAAYSKQYLRQVVKGYFGGNFSSAVSFMVKENSLSLEELEILLKELKEGNDK